MVVVVSGTRGGAGAGGGSVLGGFSLRSFFSFRIFVSTMFSLLFIATLSVLFTTNPSTPLHHSEATVLPGERGFEFLMEYVILTLWVYGVWV
uniref:Uncharacterized protein n=1 Tax=Fagus sylvatica TaxID=28930 RepID=A0A2N9ETH3_FAGSY